MQKGRNQEFGVLTRGEEAGMRECVFGRREMNEVGWAWLP